MYKAIIASLPLAGLLAACCHAPVVAPVVAAAVPAPPAPTAAAPVPAEQPVPMATEPARAPDSPVAVAGPVPPVAPEPPVPPEPPAAAATPPAAATIVASTAPDTAAPAKLATPPKPAPPAPKPPPKPAPAAAPQPAPAAPALDLAALEQRLRDTRAIGVFTKLSLKNQVDDLLDEFRAFYRGTIAVPITALRQKYDLLMLKVLSLLQDSDPPLATDIVASREAIWGILRDPAKFSTI